MKRLLLFLALFVSVALPQPPQTHPIHKAASKGRYGEIKTMLDHGIMPGLVDDQGNTPLHYAVLAKINRVRLTNLLLDANPKIVNAQNEHGITPLHIAVVTGRIRVVNALLAKGADPSRKDKNGIAPIHLATAISQFKNKSALEDGLKTFRQEKRKGVARKVATSTGLSATIGAIAGLYFFAVVLDTAAVGAIGLATVIGGLTGGAALVVIGGVAGAITGVNIIVRNRILEQLITHGGKVNLQDNAGNTPLHILADGKLVKLGDSRGGIIMARHLLRHDANRAILNNKGQTASAVAKANKRRLLSRVIKPKLVRP